MSDPVKHPDHYTVGGIETIDFLRAKSRYIEFIGHLRLTALKYLSRGPFKKNPLEDYEKAAQYLDWLIKELKDKKSKADETLKTDSYTVDFPMMQVRTIEDNDSDELKADPLMNLTATISDELKSWSQKILPIPLPIRDDK